MGRQDDWPAGKYAFNMSDSKNISFKNPDLPLAMVVTLTQWDEPPRIRHQVSRQLMRLFNVLYIEFFPCDASGRDGGNVHKVDDRLIISRPTPGRLPNVRLYANIPAVHKNVNCRYVDLIESVVKKYGKISLLCNFVPAFPEVMDLEADFKIYFCYDEWPQMWRRTKRPNSLKFAYQSRLMRLYEKKTAEASHLCLASHTPLKERLEADGNKCELFLHGHEFSELIETNASVKNNKIRVAYMGYITYNLLVDWLLKVLEYKDIELNLIGPIRRFDSTLFSKFKNFNHIDPLQGHELQAKLMDMDVLVMPYNPEIPEVRVQTVSNKFFQYVAARRPVVISDMPYYVKMPPGLVYRAKTAEAFVAKIRQAYKEDCAEYRALRGKIAGENTWDKRGEQLHAILKEALGDTIPDVEPNGEYAGA